MKLKHYTIPIFIPELACPFQCVFCDQKKISGYSKIPSEDEVRVTINSYLESFQQKNASINIGFFGGNFTGIPKSEQEKYLTIASEYIRKDKVHGIRLSTRPDYIDEDKVALLKSYSVSTVELGAQSLDEVVLQKSGRGHKAAEVIHASELIKASGISLGLQMMIGLPGDTPEKSLITAQKIIELGADNTRIYPTLVIKGTRLEEMYKDGRYSPLSLTEAVELSKKLLLMFEKSNVDVIRTGLHPSEGLLSGHELAAGPFHISFKELVLTSIWKDLLKGQVKELSNTVRIKTSADQINYAIGYEAVNRKMLQEKFRKVEFSVDPLLHDREFNVIYN